MIPWSVFLDCFPPQPKKPANDTNVHDECPGFGGLTQKHPWLLTFVSDFGGVGKTIEAVKEVVQKLQQQLNHCDVDKQRQKPAEDAEVMDDAVMNK